MGEKSESPIGSSHEHMHIEEDVFQNLTKTHWQTLLEGINDENETMQLQCLMELCNNLVLMNEETLHDFRVEQFIPPLVNILQEGEDPNMMLYACRSFYHIMEALPGSVSLIVLTMVRYNAIQVLCEKLLSIEYIDLAEQVIITLLKVSEHPSGSVHILNAGGLQALLAFIDFFALDIQLKALTAASNILHIVPKDSFGLVKDSIPIFNMLLQHQEIKMADKACISLFYIVKSISNAPDDLKSVIEQDVPLNVIKVITVHLNNIHLDGASKVIDCAIKIMTILCSKSPEIVKTLFENDLTSLLKQLMDLEKDKELKQKDLSQSLLSLISWIDTLLPVTIDEKEDGTLSTSLNKNEALKKVYESNEGLLYQLGSDLLLELVSICASRSSNKLKQQCLRVILKLTIASSSEVLTDILRELSFSSFLANQLGSRDAHFIWLTLIIIEDLMNKLPDIFKTYFVREGVVHEIENLIENPLTNESDTLVKNNRFSDLDTSSDQSKTLIERIKSFKEKFFSESSGFQHEGLEEMKRISQGFDALIQKGDQSKTEWKEQLTVLAKQLCEGTSSYEFMKSNIVTHLVSFFMKENTSLSLDERRRIRKEKLDAFIQVFHEEEKKDEVSAWIILIKSLEDAVGKLESFDVTLDSFENSIRNIKYLTRPMRFKIIPSKEERQYSHIIETHVEPLASFKKVKDYIISRIKKMEKMKIRNDGYSEPEHDPVDDEADHSGHEEEEDHPLDYEEDHHMDTEEERQDDEDEEPMPEDQILNEEGDHPEDDYSSSEDEEDEEDDYDDYSSEYSESEDFVDLSEIQDVDSIMNEPEIQDNRMENDTQSTQETHDEVKQEEPMESMPLKVNLYYKGVSLVDDMTTFQFARKNPHEVQAENSLHFLSFWSQYYTIEYEVVREVDTVDDSSTLMLSQQNVDTPFKSMVDYYIENPCHENLVSSKQDSTSNELKTYLDLIEILYLIHGAFDLKHNELIYYNAKLSSKINRQIQDPFSVCSGLMPDWMKSMMIRYKFLFSFDIRRRFFQSTSFGIGRALFSIKDRLEDVMDIRFGRIHRKKVRVHRDKIFESSFSVFKLVKDSTSILEIEYFDEVATGLGPTLEFYTLLSSTYQKKSLNMWVDHHTSEDYVFCSGGLFPKPISKSAMGSDALRVKYFENFGSFIAKSILDERLLDIHLSIPFIKYLVGQPVLIGDMKDIYPEIVMAMSELHELVQKKKLIEADPSITSKREAIDSLQYKGGRVDDLLLNFTLPGYPDIELEEGGSEKWVNIDNVESYIHHVVRYITYDGVKDAMDAVIHGFNRIFDIGFLRYFAVHEVNILLGGEEKQDHAWDLEKLKENTKCEHGYTSSSKAVQYMLEIMSEFDEKERRQFLQFLTGSPRLPPGGFQSLNPKLTFVRKDAENGANPDNYLPSVNTCFLYLKMPDYSTKEVAKRQLLRAMEHGQQGFSMS